jgi:predicted MFS family arabinose efflux permease
VGIGVGVILGGVFSAHLGYASAFWSGVVVNALGIISYFAFSRSHYYRHKLR